MKIILMKHTIAFLGHEAQIGNENALKTLMFNKDTVEIIENEKYIVITDKKIPDNNEKN